MKVTKAQAQANRARIVETASALFRERGYDGVGVADLMAAAGFTHGGFYKHFASKAHLMAEAAVCGLSQGEHTTPASDAGHFIDEYLSRQHRDARGSGCTLAALGADAARQPDFVKAEFAVGLERLVGNLAKGLGDTEGATATATASAAAARMDALDTVARLVGAIVLSRACPDDAPLADEILQACRAKLHEESVARGIVT